MFKKFSQSAKNLKDTRVLCASAILAALYVALYSIKLPITPQLRITFTFIPLAVSGWLFGVIPAMIVGAIGDIIGAFLFPQGAYFPGFTLTSLFAGLIFGLFLYKSDNKNLILRIFVSRFLINMLLNTLLNSLWLVIITSKGYYFHLVQHFVKNISTLPIEVILLFIIFKFLSNHRIRKMYK